MNEARPTDGQRIWRLAPGVRYRRLFDEAVLVPPGGDAVALNDSAARFIECCDGSRRVDEIVALLVAEFVVDPAELAADLRPFIERLAADGLLREAR